ncbi:hypothetical protein [Exiguobacterium chiriqhucha]|uniref:Uncharacterized protein n=1 Tax=Exiguobacterium chiriqhucha RW-2 TaxID=1345023 RepID=U1LX42_9BACL|nr:hypothetical protein [Exiguobacterium chiriqhucha]ERG66827.1 hypothetical protein M467_05985 [Exiguobacterium chiriqhucha RW-2]
MFSKLLFGSSVLITLTYILFDGPTWVSVLQPFTSMIVLYYLIIEFPSRKKAKTSSSD